LIEDGVWMGIWYRNAGKVEEVHNAYRIGAERG
jgi:hypothetical protein